MNQLAVKFRRLANAGDLALPSYATSGAAGLILPPQLTSQFVSNQICARPFQPDLPWHYQQVMKRKSGHDRVLH